MIGFYTDRRVRGKVIGKSIKIQEGFGDLNEQCIHIRYGDADISVYARLRNTEASATDESQRAPVLLPELPVIFPWEHIDGIIENAVVEDMSLPGSEQIKFFLQYQEVMRGGEAVKRQLGWYPSGARIYIDHIALLYCNSHVACSEMQVNIGRGPVILQIEDYGLELLCENQGDNPISQSTSAQIYIRGKRENTRIMELTRDPYSSDVIVSRYYRNANMTEAKMCRHLDNHRLDGALAAYYRYNL